MGSTQPGQGLGEVKPPPFLRGLVADLKVEKTPKWWLKPYIHGVALFCVLMGAEPNWERFRYWSIRGFKYYIVFPSGTRRRIL